MPKRDTLQTKVFSEINSVIDKKLEVDVGGAVDFDELREWAIDSNQQAIDERTGEYVQFFSERSYKPVQIYSDYDISFIGQNVEAIAAQTEDEELTSVANRKTKDSRLLWMGIIAALFAVVISIVVLVNL